MIKYLIEKEFKQLLRNSFLPKLIFIFPCMTMILLPWAANLEIRNIYLNIVDNDRSVTSQRLIQKIAASTYFRITGVPDSYDEALIAVEEGTADIILEIAPSVERSSTLSPGETAPCGKHLIAANAVNGTKGGLGSSYLAAIINDFSAELRAEVSPAGSVSGTVPVIGIETQNLFNSNLNYKLYMVPALMVMLLTLICGFLPALNIVSEKEVGTIEQINVTPVGKFTFILAKLLPYWIIGFLVLSLCFLLAWLLYGLVPAGHFGVIYAFALLFVFTVSGMGLVISNYSSTMQQSMFVMWFCLLILMLMSGLFTPINSMPGWAQGITYLNPLRYFVQVMRMAYLKGSGFADLLPQLGALVAFALLLNGWAVWSYRKRS